MQRESETHGELAQINNRATVGNDFDSGATRWLNPSLPVENELVDRDRDPETAAEHIPVTAGR
ncbi:hypothetical protein [Halococcus thailandensis]|uniref:hypothetical protein n=1 Tax=Halococcus thailandensis TaxID=335952 RepID=UPI0006780CB7|nr:hypothetical protein [Halococcus thailandensis]